MKPWREACETVLRTFSEEDSIRFWRVAHEGGAQTSARAIFNYRFEHTLAAVKIARWLAAKTGADAEVLECAAWLHDCAKRLCDPGHKDTHAQEASELVEGILADTDFPVEKIPAVRHAIEHHVGLRLANPLEPLETACLWDADKLSKIGAASLVHFGCISGAFQPIDTAGILERGEHWLVLARGTPSPRSSKELAA
jgi:HD superfamily phosphodiesterase